MSGATFRFLLGVLLTLPLCAGEIAVFQTGFSLRVQSHENSEGKVILHTNSGRIEMNADQVLRFDVDDYVAPKLEPVATTATPVTAKAVQMSARELVERAADKYGLPPALLHSVAKAESGYQVDALSPKGAIGLMQLMPGTAAELNADPRDPEQNADAGARYLRELLLKYNGSAHRALAAYNAGPGAVQKYNGVPPYRETREYIDRIIREYNRSALR
jgi:soluble lytic murein transglycosylase-like protein